jgi:NAD+ synthase (glutamine-hydrolysing)
MNRNSEVIPKNIITKPPSAELRPDQKDTDTLPDYDVLDEILYQFIEQKESESNIIQMRHAPDVVKWVVKRVNQNEYKRFQTPPILRVSSKAFGMGRRIPLVASFEGL